MLNAVLDLVQASPCATLLASECEMAVLMAHLRHAMDPKMPGKESSYLAFWDPAVLAALLGQSDLDTQSRIEPVLNPAQIRALLGPIARWWCWSRSGRLHEYAVTDLNEPAAPLPLHLSAAQVDALVQGNVPDLLIYYVHLNQVHLRDKLPPLAMHWFARQQLKRLIKPYLGVLVAGSITLVGAASLIEMIYHMQLNAAMGSQVPFMGAQLDTSVAATWTVAIVIFVVGLGLLETARRMTARRWGQIQEAIEESIKKGEG